MSALEVYKENLRMQIKREMPPLVDPKDCTLDDIECILATDPTASIAYDNELARRQERQKEVDHWEEKYGI